jgi:DNA-binding MarR family transcriptional regulator
MTKKTNSSDDLAARVWSGLKTFVDAQEKRKELQEILGLGRGLGRVKLLLLLAGGPMTLRDIAETNGIDAPYATVVVDKLVELGLVERTAHPDDNRRKLVTLTKAGREATRLAARILAEPPSSIATLPLGDLAYLDDLLARLNVPPGEV